MDGGSTKAQRALEIAEDYDNVLSTILIGNNVVNIASTSIATILFTNLFGASGAAISTAVMTVLVLILVRSFPKLCQGRTAKPWLCALLPSGHADDGAKTLCVVL